MCAAAPSAAHAQTGGLPECFGPAPSGSAAAFLGSSIALRAECEYSLDPNTGFRALGTSRTMSFLAVLGELGWRDTQLPVLYGRPRAAAAEVGAAPSSAATPPASSLILAHCTDYMLQAQGSFEVRPDAGARRLVIRRASSACGAAAMNLEFRCNGGELQSMARTASTLTLPACEGSWQVAARIDGPATYALGAISSGRPTALLDYFANERTQSELLVPDFTRSERGFALRRGRDAGDALWAELQLAVAAGSLRMMRGSGANVCESGERIGIAAGADRIEMDAEPMARFMIERHGQTGQSLVPGATEWFSFFSDVHVCMASSHGVHPAVLRSKSLGQVASLQQIGQVTPVLRFCVEEPRMSLRPDGAAELDRAQHCMTTGDGAVLVTTQGATLASVPAGTLLCQGETEISETPATLERGFYELRTESPGRCGGASGLSAGRIAVLDPAQDWAPVGLTRSADGETDESVPAWRGVRRDDPATFAFRRSEDELRFRVASPEGIAASWNNPRSQRSTVLSDQAPIVGQETGDYGRAAALAVAAWSTKKARCERAT